MNLIIDGGGSGGRIKKPSTAGQYSIERRRERKYLIVFLPSSFSLHLQIEYKYR